MSRHEGRDISSWLPWLATGTLTEQERAEVEAALAADPEARAELDDVREMARLADGIRVEDCLAEISPELLVEYAEEPETLADETRRWVESRIAASDDTRELFNGLLRAQHAVAVTGPSAPAQTAAVEPAATVDGLWQRLRRSVLGPAPALGYLVLLVALPALWWVVRDDAPAGGVPRRVAVEAGRSLRSPEITDTPAGLTVGRGFALLELQTGLTPEDLAGVDLHFEMSTPAGRSLASPVDGAARRRVAGRIVVDVVVDTGRLRPRTLYTLTLRGVAPGHPLDGQRVFQRELLTREED